MPFFESSQNPQILYLFQFIQPLSPRRACSRPISNLSYRFLFPKSQFSIFRNLLQILLLYNLTSKLIYTCVFLFKLYSYLSLFRRLGYSYLILRILYYRELLSLAYLYIFKLSYYSLLLVCIYYRSQSYSYLILRVQIFSYLVLRILSLQPFAFIK